MTDFMGFLVVLAIVGLLVGVGFGIANDSNRSQHCVEGGGQVLTVHGGRGGWVCLPKEVK